MCSHCSLCLSVHWSVGLLVHRSVSLSVNLSLDPLVSLSHTGWISKKWVDFEQNSTKNKKLYYLKDNSRTSMRADRQNASDVCTLTDLLSYFKVDKYKSVGISCILNNNPYHNLPISHLFDTNNLAALLLVCIVVLWNYHLCSPRCQVCRSCCRCDSSISCGLFCSVDGSNLLQMIIKHWYPIRGIKWGE